MLSGILLSSCGQPGYRTGQTAAPVERTAISSDRGEMRYWDTDDVAIGYRLQDEQDNLVISGWVEIADSVLYTFPNVRFFYLYLHQLDAEGKGTSREAITPLYSSRAPVDNRLQFSRRISKDREAVAIAFSYWGVFEENIPLFRRGGDSWEIHHNPFRN